MKLEKSQITSVRPHSRRARRTTTHRGDHPEERRRCGGLGQARLPPQKVGPLQGAVADQKSIQVLEAEAKRGPLLASRIGVGRLQQACVGPLHLRHKGEQGGGGGEDPDEAGSIDQGGKRITRESGGSGGASTGGIHTLGGGGGVSPVGRSRGGSTSAPGVIPRGPRIPPIHVAVVNYICSAALTGGTYVGGGPAVQAE